MECSRCYQEYANREKLHERIKLGQGCEKPSPKMVANIEYGSLKIVFKRCVGNFYWKPLEDYLRVYELYNAGVIPYPGSLMDQPAKFVELMDLLHNLTQRRERELREEAARKHGRKRS